MGPCYSRLGNFTELSLLLERQVCTLVEYIYTVHHVHGFSFHECRAKIFSICIAICCRVHVDELVI